MVRVKPDDQATVGWTWGQVVGAADGGVRALLRRGWSVILERRPESWTVCGVFPSPSLAMGYVGGCWEREDQGRLVLVEGGGDRPDATARTSLCGMCGRAPCECGV